jgi:4-guanidinobutyraldehyde dehydrogenase/NAD-dependent aldehyde dehydrogenase
MNTVQHSWVDAAGHKVALDVRPFIDGRRVGSASSESWTKHSPSDGRPLMEFAVGSAADVDRAVSSGRAAFEDGRWCELPVAQRCAILLKLADFVDRDAKTLAAIETLEVGKPIRDAQNIDLALAGSVLRYNAVNADKAVGTVVPADSRSLCQTTRSPRGVVGAIVGWNFPLVLAILKAAPALATGNSLVLKPSELSSLSALRLAELALEAGVPEGVFNVVPGIGKTVGDALARHRDLDMLSFTGSSATGRQLMVSAGQSSMKPLLLECGGKSPNIVFDDCPDLDAVADAVTARMYWNQGQVCTAGSRLLVQESVKAPLLARIRKRAQALVPGNPFDPATTCGPLISAPQMSKVLGYIQSGIEQGGKLILGGHATLAHTGGYFVETTIFDEVRPQMRIGQEEIFGPVLAVMTFADAEHACQLANSTSYGLSATVWTRSLAHIHLMMKKLRAGDIDIKATARPSAGTMLATLPMEPHKQSGIGVEGGIEGLQSYTILRSVRIFTD